MAFQLGPYNIPNAVADELATGMGFTGLGTQGEPISKQQFLDAVILNALRRELIRLRIDTRTKAMHQQVSAQTLSEIP